MDLGSRITDVEKLITYDLTVVADILKNAHQLHIPMLQRNRYAAADRLNVLDQEVQSKIEEIASVVEDVQTDAISDEATSIRSRLEALGEARHFVETVEEIERHIASCYVTDVAILTRAQIVKELQSLMKECVEAGTAISVGESILSSLGNAVREQREYLGWVLSDFFRSAIDFSQHPRGYYTMNINFASAYDATNYFTAMQDVGELDPRLTRWATFVVDKLCAAVISGGGRSDSVRSRVDRTEATRTVFEVRIPQKNEKASIDCSAVFTLLSTLFKSISQALAGVSVHQSPLSLLLGRKIEKPLMTLVLKEVMTVCVPAATSLDDPLFKEVVETAEKFRADLIEQQIFNDASASFGSFSESTERVFIDRRCLSILNQARDLIIAPYLTLTSVGHDGEVAEETLGDFENVFGKSLSTNIRSMDDTYPRLFAMQRCQVSESTMKLVELIEQTLRDAAHVDSEMAAERLALTARNIVQLFVLTAPKQHHTAISSVPEQAAVFFNNCYFILHRIMMMGFNLCKDQTKQIVESFRPVFSDNVVRLRLIAAEALEGLLAQCRRNISAELVDRNFFSSAYLNGDMEREVRVPKVLRRCTDQISSVAVVFRRVLTETVYGKSLGNLCSFLLTELGELVLGMEDITQADANFTALDLEKVLEDHLMPHFEIGGFNIMHKMCENAFFRTKEIIFCLKGSLQGIDDRWCAGKGPLAQWLTAAEVRHLVKALFANSELRKRLLEKIF